MTSFRSNTVVMLALALVFGGAAVFLVRLGLGQPDRQHRVVTPALETPTQTLVVAAAALRYGSVLTPAALKEIPWPGNALPAGAFAKIEDLQKDGARTALQPLEAFEPILQGKITGPGQRAGLDALLGEGLRAATIRVNDINGVAGFILPGNRVDVLITQTADNKNSTDLVLPNVKVLAVDQLADQKSDKPTLVKAVTVEVTPQAAQKLALAANLGQLSLTLRPPGEDSTAGQPRVTASDLFRPDTGTFAAAAPTTSAIRVMRGGEQKDYIVPIDAAP